MDVKELRKLEIGELNKKLAEALKELSKLTYEASLGKLKDTSKLKKGRGDVSRMLTIIKEKEILKNG
ncbi:MAG: 50S ribosomal protein L29 [Patescibacteria group bacterium]|nr:50S ribosomal protein L29 [Patescibacteria group bacterium]